MRVNDSDSRQRISIGDKGYYQIGSDSYPITCISVSPKKAKIGIRFESFSPGDKHDYYGVQQWIILPNINGRIDFAYWSTISNTYRLESGHCYFGHWRAYKDPSF